MYTFTKSAQDLVWNYCLMLPMVIVDILFCFIAADGNKAVGHAATPHPSKQAGTR